MKSLSHLNKYFVKYKWHFALGIVFTIISNYFGIKMPLYVKETIDEMLKNDKLSDPDNLILTALKIGGIYMGLSLASGFFLFLMRQTIIIMSRLIEFDLKNEIYTHYQRLDFTFYKKNATGDLMNRISEDVSQVRMYLGPGIMYTINLVILSIMVIYQMWQISGTLTLFVLMPLPVMSFLIYKVSSKMNTLSKQVQQEQSLLSTIAQESFAGIRVIKAYSREDDIRSRFDETSNAYKTKNMNLVKVNALFLPTIVFLIGLSTLITIYLGGRLTYSGAISPGAILAVIFYVNKLTWPFASLGWVTSINQRAAASQTRINEFLLQAPIIQNPTNEPLVLKGEISFNNVSLTYENSGIQAIKNLSFSMKPGEQLAILGNTGSGKSSVLNLLTRQIDPSTGSITIDGKNLKEINLEAYRSQLGIVPQDVFLFSETIKENIQFGSENSLTLDQLKQASKQAHVLHNIEAFPNQFDTVLGERGVNISGGQKQRVSIARALVRNPKLLLLDDCLSAVDTETEEIILSNLKRNEHISSTLIVSHRISSIRNADRILVLHDGECVEQGTYDELLEKQGHFYAIHQKQLNDMSMH